MAILSNPRKERFCLNYIKYECNKAKRKEIMEEAGYRLNRGYFITLLKDPEIQGRVLELKQEAANSEILNLRDRLKLLSEIAKNEKEKTSQRISAINSIHRQSGDDVINVSNEDSKGAKDNKGANVVRFIDVKLPQQSNKKEEETKEVKDNMDKELEELDKLDKMDNESQEKAG